MRVWVREPNEDTPSLCYVEEDWIIGDMVINLADSSDFSFKREGVMPKLITIEHCGKTITHDTELLSIQNISLVNPLIAFYDQNLCKLWLLHVWLFFAQHFRWCMLQIL